MGSLACERLKGLIDSIALWLIGISYLLVILTIDMKFNTYRYIYILVIHVYVTRPTDFESVFVPVSCLQNDGCDVISKLVV